MLHWIFLNIIRTLRTMFYVLQYFLENNCCRSFHLCARKRIYCSIGKTLGGVLKLFFYGCWIYAFTQIEANLHMIANLSVCCYSLKDPIKSNFPAPWDKGMLFPLPWGRPQWLLPSLRMQYKPLCHGCISEFKVE